MTAVVQQTQNLKNFIATNLGDVIDLNRHVEADPIKTTTGDIAYMQIKTPFNIYKIAMGSAYAEPPAGAPAVCRSLGWITFQHVGEDKYVLSPKNDHAYNDISRHIHERELTDALAACRREMAEAKSVDEANLVRIRMKELASKAERWGIKAKMPEEPKQLVVSDERLMSDTPLPTSERLAAYVFQAKAHAGGLAPFVGAQVIYYSSDRIAGMDEIPGVLVRDQRDGRAAMFLMADLNEITFKDNVVRRGSDAGNGRVHTTNCWDFNPEWLKEQERIKKLENDLELLLGHRQTLTGMMGRLIDIEAAMKSLKPRRGRPPKSDEPDEIEGAELASELGSEDAA